MLCSNILLNPLLHFSLIFSNFYFKLYLTDYKKMSDNFNNLIIGVSTMI